MKKNDSNYTAILEDITAVMERHGVTNMMVLTFVNGAFRNTCLTTTGKQNEVLNFLSDGVDGYLREYGGYTSKPKK